MRWFLLVVLSCIVLSAQDEGVESKRANILYIQQLIQKEEFLAQVVEKYILKNYVIPVSISTINKDIYNNELDLTNRFLDKSIEFKDKGELRLDYAIADDKSLNKEYLKLLYNRDLYRDRTRVYDDKNPSSRYTKIVLKSPEAQNIYEFIKLNKQNKIKKCKDKTTQSKGYCIEGEHIRYYKPNFGNHSIWIEYEKQDYKNSNVSIGSKNNFGGKGMSVDEIMNKLQTDVELKANMKDIKIGAYVFVQNNEEKTKVVKYMKTGKDQYLKVE